MRMWLAALALAIAGPGVAQRQAPAQPPLRPEIVEAYVDGVLRQAMESTATAAATVAIVQDGRVVLAKGYGLARVAPRPRAADADTLFQVASISKTPVYLAIMQLVEHGRLKLDDPINRHLPPRLRVPDNGLPPITVRHLMTHTAGFEDSALGHLFVGRADRLIAPDDYLARYRVTRVRRPGVQQSYSNYGIALLGRIVAGKHGADWPTVAEQRVLRPLGLRTASYRDPYPARAGLPAPLPPALAATATQQLAGGPGQWKLRQAEYVTHIAAAGGMRASANDMAAYLLALTDPARLEAAGVLRRESFAAMVRPAIDLPGATRHGFLNYRMPGDRWGFGHGGAMGFGASDLVVVPDLRLGIFVSTNGRGGFQFANDFARRLIDQFYDGAETPPIRSAAVAARAKQVAGGWIANRRAFARSEAFLMRFNAYSKLQARANGDLVRTPFGGKPELFVPIGGDRWRSAKRLTIISFGKDAHGHETLWTSVGSGGAQRPSLLERPMVVLGILAVGLIFAAGVVIRRLWGMRRLPALPAPARVARLASGLAALLWTIGLGGLFAFLIASLDDDAAAGVLFSYPDGFKPFVILLAVAAVATLAALWTTVRAVRGGQASRWAFVPLVVLLGIAGVAWHNGILGFTGFGA